MGHHSIFTGCRTASALQRQGRPVRGFGRRFWRETCGATSVEYAVMLALILGVILGSISLLGTNTKQLWTNNSTTLQGVGFGS